MMKLTLAGRMLTARQTAVTVSMPLVDDPSVSLLIWTTTPWTLPSNLAVCVNPEFKYLKIHDEDRNQTFIIFEGLLTTLYKDPKKAKFKKVGEVLGKDLVGLKYEPIFPYFYENVGALCPRQTQGKVRSRLGSSKTQLSVSFQTPM
jgi:isoleucyl-tRNA synthetase